MKIDVTYMYCKPCKKNTDHIYGTSAGGRKWNECTECGHEIRYWS